MIFICLYNEDATFPGITGAGFFGERVGLICFAICLLLKLKKKKSCLPVTVELPPRLPRVPLLWGDLTALTLEVAAGRTDFDCFSCLSLNSYC